MANLEKKAMLCSLTIRQWSGRIQDKEATQKVASDNGAAEHVVNVRKSLIDRTALKEITQCVSEARTTHAKFTLPWTDRGARILPAAKYADYQSKMIDIKSRFEAAVNKFLSNYQLAIDEAKYELANLFKQSDYPTEDCLRRKFRFNTHIVPLSTANDFRVDLGQAEVERIKANIQNDFGQAEQGLRDDLYNRIFDAVSRMAESLPKYDPDKKGKEKGTFRDTIVTNIRELVSMLPQLNVTEDPRIDELTKVIESELGSVDADDLRKDKEKREDTAAKAQAIADAMAGWMTDDDDDDDDDEEEF